MIVLFHLGIGISKLLKNDMKWQAVLQHHFITIYLKMHSTVMLILNDSLGFNRCLILRSWYS